MNYNDQVASHGINIHPCIVSDLTVNDVWLVGVVRGFVDYEYARVLAAKDPIEIMELYGDGIYEYLDNLRVTTEPYDAKKATSCKILASEYVQDFVTLWCRNVYFYLQDLSDPANKTIFITNIEWHEVPDHLVGD